MEVEGKTSLDFAIHLPKPPGHQAERALPKDLGTRAPVERWTCSSSAAHVGQPQNKSPEETPCSLWKISVVVHDSRSLERHL